MQFLLHFSDSQDLYHELHALDRFEQDYRRKLEEEKQSVVFERGKSFIIDTSEASRIFRTETYDCDHQGTLFRL